jgi:hypothetical protein
MAALNRIATRAWEWKEEEGWTEGDYRPRAQLIRTNNFQCSRAQFNGCSWQRIVSFKRGSTVDHIRHKEIINFGVMDMSIILIIIHCVHVLKWHLVPHKYAWLSWTIKYIYILKTITKMNKIKNLPWEDYRIKPEKFEGQGLTSPINHKFWLHHLCSTQFEWTHLKISQGYDKQPIL